MHHPPPFRLSDGIFNVERLVRIKVQGISPARMCYLISALPSKLFHSTKPAMNDFCDMEREHEHDARLPWVSSTSLLSVSQEFCMTKTLCGRGGAT